MRLAIAMFCTLITISLASGCKEAKTEEKTERWYPLYDYWSKGTGVYVDSTSIREVKGEIVIGMKIESDDISPSNQKLIATGQSATRDYYVVMQFNCDLRQYRELRTEMTLANGTSYSRTPRDVSIAVMPNSIDEGVMNYACSNRP